MWRKYRDREKIAEVCNEGTAIKDNQRDESFIHEVGRAGLATPSRPCLLRTIPLPPAPLSLSLFTSFLPTRNTESTRSTPVGAGRFGAQENDFRRREKAISREYETRELSRVVSALTRETHRKLCFRKLFHCATSLLQREYIL